MTTGRAEIASAENVTEQKSLSPRESYISRIESHKEEFKKLQKGADAALGFDVLKEKIATSMSTSVRLLDYGIYNLAWSNLLDEWHTEEAKEYDLYAFNDHSIYAKDRLYLNELITQLLIIQSEAEAEDCTDDLTRKASRYVPLCIKASNFIDEVERCLTKYANRFPDLDAPMTTGTVVKAVKTLGYALVGGTIVTSWQPPRCPADEERLFRVYLNDLAARLDRIRHSVAIQVEKHFSKVISKDSPKLFKPEQSKVSVAGTSEEKKQEISKRM